MGDSATNQPSPSDSNRDAGIDADPITDAPDSRDVERLKTEALHAELSMADVVSLPGAPARTADLFRERTSWSGGDVTEEAKDPLLGTTLHDTYVVSRVLGEGGMGRVYEAHHTRISTKRFAIKVLHPEFSQNPEIRLRFQREAEAAATIEHDGVVGTYDLGKTPQGWPYMVCEYLAGIDLNDYLKQRGTLSTNAIVHVGRQLCSALGAAHARGVIHRDLKPHNVFVVEQHQETSFDGSKRTGDPDLPLVKVLDFGLSRFVEGDNELTQAGIILGTPGYMAPEQANGRETDIRTDIYGIGALLFAAATGRPPFREESPQLTVLAVMNREPPRPRDLCASLPVDLEIVIQKAMARDPSDRYRTAGEMEAALAQLYDASAALNRRAPRTLARSSSAPRIGLLVYGGSAFVLGGLSLVGAVFALFEIEGVRYADFRPSVLEWLLFVALGLVLLFVLTLALRRFKRQTWGNSARVADLTTKIRSPLIAAIFAYGLSALAIRLATTLGGITSGSLARAEFVSDVSLFVLLPINSLLAASAVIFRDAFGAGKSALARGLANVGYPLVASLLGLSLLVVPFTWHPLPGPSRLNIAEASIVERSIAAPEASAPSVGAPSSPQNADKSGSLPPPAKPARPSGPTPALAPEAELAIAAEDGADALAELGKKYPQDPKLLKALVLAHASRADTIAQSAQAIVRLLEIDPAAKKDGEIVFILKRALITKGAAHDAASAVVTTRMGPEGAELLYELMSEHPEQRSRLRGLFQDLRKANQASAAVLVAYDLRYATRCQARLPLLEAAEAHGDLRSLHQLQALSTTPKRCGWGRTCYPACRAEAARFHQSAKAISKRLGRVE